MTIRKVDAVLEQVPASATPVYTRPTAAKSATITYAACNNEDSTATTVTVNIVQSGGSVAVTNEYISAKSVASKTNVTLSEIVGRELGAGVSIHALAADASRLNLAIGILETY